MFKVTKGCVNNDRICIVNYGFTITKIMYEDDPTDLFQEVWSFLHLGEINGIIVVNWHNLQYVYSVLHEGIKIYVFHVSSTRGSTKQTGFI